MSKYPDHEIEGILGHPRSDGMIAYRQMLAMEKIAVLLAEISEKLETPPTLVPVASSEEVAEIGPALQHSRRRRFSEPT